MSVNLNPYGQPVGDSLPGWQARPAPARITLEGRFCRLEPLDAERHAAGLFEAYRSAADDRDWTYMMAGPFHEPEAYRQYAETAASSIDPLHYAVIDRMQGKAVGTLALMRIDRNNGAIEVGHVAFSPLLRQKPAATEAQFLLMQYVFEQLHYRRYEWKCDSLNAPSRKAAERLGFRFEGIFRQAVVYRGRTRDTAWHSILDSEWPLLKSAFLAWLRAQNFDAAGQQQQTLVEIRAALSGD